MAKLVLKATFGVLIKANESIVNFLLLYVDGTLLIGNDIPTLQDVKSWLGKCFVMKDLGEAKENELFGKVRKT